MWNVCLLELEVTLPRPFMKGKENKEQGDQTSGCRRSYLVRSSEDLLLNLLGAMNARYFSFNSHEWQFHKGRQFQSVRSQSSRAEHQLDWAGICFQNLGRKWRRRKTETGNTGQLQQCCSLMHRETVFLLHEVEVQSKSKLVSTVKSNQRGFRSIWKAKGGSNVILIHCLTRLVINKDIDKAKTLKPFSALVFNISGGPWCP